MAINVATAHIPVLPDMGNFAKEIVAGVTKPAREAGRTVAKEMTATATSSGKEYGQKFSKDVAASTKTVGKTVGQQVAKGVQEGTRGTGAKVGEELVRDINGKLRNSKGQFVGAGTQAGRGFGSGFVKEAGAVVKRQSRSITAPLTTMGGIGALAFGAMGVAAVKFGVNAAAGMENAQIAFTTMLRSGTKARQFLGELQQFAAKTPFEFSDLTTAAQRMLAFGFTAKQVVPTLTAIGDAAAGLGGSAELVQQITMAIGQIQAKGKVQSDELLQLTEAGVPALKILANQYGVTTGKMQQMVTDGVVPASKAVPLLLQGIENGTKGAAGQTTRFAGLMDKQSHTLTGILSNLKDQIAQTAVKVFTPFMPQIKQFTLALSKAFGQFAAFFLRDIMPLLISFFNFADKHKATMKALALGIIVAAGAFKVLSISMAIFNAVANANPIVLIVDAIALLVIGLVVAYKRSETFRNIVNTVFRAVGAVAMWLWHNAIQPAMAGIVAAFNWVMKVAGPIFSAIGTAGKFMWDYFLHPIFIAIGFYITKILIPYYQFLWAVAKVVWAGLSLAISVAWAIIHPILTVFGVTLHILGWVTMAAFKVVAALVWLAIRTQIQIAWAIIRPILKAFALFFSAVLAPAFRWFYNTVVAPVMHAVSSAIQSAWTHAIRPAWHAMQGGLDALGQYFVKTKNWIKRTWDSLVDIVKKPIRFIIDKIINHGILNAWDTVVKWLKLPKQFQIPFVGIPFADGGIIKQFADGGVENHTAQIAPAGAMRLWAEPETGGEAYIPLASSKRSRSTAILNQVASEFGYGLTPYADGGINRKQKVVAFKDGGLFGSIADAASKVINKGVSFGKNILDAVANPAKYVGKALMAPVNALLKNVPLGGSAVTDVGKKMITGVPLMKDGLVGAMKTALTHLLGMFSGGGSGAAIVQKAIAELGQGEQPAGSNNTKYGRWFGVNPAPWCAMFVDYVASKAGVSKYIPHTASAPGMASAFGKRYHGGAAGIQPGDIPFFSNGGGISHVGLVEKVNGNTVGTIEGNHTSIVQRVNRPRGAIVGYGHPGYPIGEGGSLSLGGGGTVDNKNHALNYWSDDVSQVLNEVHSSHNALMPVLRRIQHESGGNPSAVNKWDSNWKAGHPSVGLMQVIKGTFDAYAGSYRNMGPKVYGVSEAPKANIYAGVNYAKHRYGGSWVSVMDRAGGYDSGGWFGGSGNPSVAISGTRKPEAVFTDGQWSRIDRIVQHVDQQAATGEMGGDTFHINAVLAGDPEELANKIENKRRLARRTRTFAPIKGGN
jgi:tape measure domain-containing protein